MEAIFKSQGTELQQHRVLSTYIETQEEEEPFKELLPQPVPPSHPISTLPCRVADTDPNPDLFGRIRIRKFFTGSVSGSYWYFGNVKLYKQ